MVTEPGIYADLTNEEYHAHDVWASSSHLKALLPEHYKLGGNREALDFGTLFHTAVLEPENLAEYQPLDAEKIGVKADGTLAKEPTMTAAWKRAVAEAEAEGKKVVAQSDLDRVLAMRDEILFHDTAPRLLFAEGRAVEESAFAVIDDVRCRARFDVRIPGGIVDLKSTSAKPGAYSLNGAIKDYGYDLSAAHYLAVAQALDLDATAFSLVFVTKEPPHRVTVVDLLDGWLERGRVLRRRALDRFKHDPDAYEGSSGYLALDCPPWAELRESA